MAGTQDGAPPGAIAERAREQLLRYRTVAWRDGSAATATATADGFQVRLEDGSRHEGARLVLATGVVDELPDLPGLRERWGTSVFVCPYCDGYELEKGRLGVLATGALWFHQAMLIPEWGATTLFTGGVHGIETEQRVALAARGVTVEEGPVAAVEGERATMRMADGRGIPLDGLFLIPRTRFATPLASDLGCALEDGPMGPFIRTDTRKETSVPGVFACGDVARAAGSVSLAVGDGALTGTVVHQSLVFG